MLLIKQIRQVTMIQTHCNWNSDAAAVRTFLLVLITTWHDRVTWCCKVAVTETKPLRTSYLSYRHRNLCWPSQGSAIVAAAGVCLTPFASHKSALYPNERLAVSCDLDSQGLNGSLHFYKSKVWKSKENMALQLILEKVHPRMRWGRSTGGTIVWDI